MLNVLLTVGYHNVRKHIKGYDVAHLLADKLP